MQEDVQPPISQMGADLKIVKIETFLFDMGNVLVHFSHDLMCEQMGALCGHSGADVRRLLLDSGLQWEFERGRISIEQFHTRFQEAVGRPVDMDKLLHAGSDIFRLNESLVPVIDTLKQRGHRLVLLSNTSVAHFGFIHDRWDILQRFDDFVVSYKVGAIKPEAAMFETALQRIHCPPTACLYTDDIPEYVARAREFGLQAEVFTNTAAYVRHLRDRGIEL